MFCHCGRYVLTNIRSARNFGRYYDIFRNLDQNRIAGKVDNIWDILHTPVKWIVDAVADVDATSDAAVADAAAVDGAVVAVVNMWT